MAAKQRAFVAETKIHLANSEAADLMLQFNFSSSPNSCMIYFSGRHQAHAMQMKTKGQSTYSDKSQGWFHFGVHGRDGVIIAMLLHTHISLRIKERECHRILFPEILAFYLQGEENG